MTHPDLAELYSRSMECQVNVGQDGGTRIDGEYKGVPWQAWTDGVQQWKSFRIPRNAATEPTFEDKAMSFDLSAHAEGIGMTGWDWENRLSRWVGFDFDSIVGHKESHAKRLGPEELDRVQEIACSMPWVTVRRSTSGKGRHLHVPLEAGIRTANHTEHAAVGRAVLGKLSALTGYDFVSKVDVAGANMWIWHRKMAGSQDGLKLIRAATELCTVPINWKDHIPVISGRRRRMASPNPESESEALTEDEQAFDDLAAQHPRTPLDDEHRRLLTWILDPANTGIKQAWWDQDRHMLICHTETVKEAHRVLGLRGVFDTQSTGSSDHNVFLIPLRRGSWVVRRYGKGVGEHVTWGQDAQGYTRCFLNREPDLATASRAQDGVEDEKRVFHFVDTNAAMEAARLLGITLEMPPWPGRAATMKQMSDGRLVAAFERKDTDASPGKGWLAKKDQWVKVNEIRQAPEESAAAEGTGVYDDIVRHISNELEDCGWVIRHEGGIWKGNPLVHVKPFLKAQGLNAKEVEIVVGRSVSKSWTLVNAPFQEEYPGSRKWNRNAAQLAYVPSQSDTLNYPHWNLILQHCGASLNEAVKIDAWCQANAVLTGPEYLKAWIASLFQHPLEPLPYLFFWSEEQNTGKSIFHEALSLLMTKGYVRADNALISQSGFNGELRTAVLCAIEEVDLSAVKSMAYNRIKDWVTAKQLSIHQKNQTPYQIDNSTHWVQTGQSLDFCPAFPGDTRIVVVNVPALVKEIPKMQMLDELRAEASDFLAAVLRVELPKPTGRLFIPVLQTADKITAQRTNESPVQRFFEENIHYVPGAVIKYGEMYTLFQSKMDPTEVGDWTKQKFGKYIPSKYPKARSRHDGDMYIGNAATTIPDKPSGPRLITRADIRGELWLDPEVT